MINFLFTVVFPILSTIASIAYAVWENRKVKKNKALIYELQQLALHNYHNSTMIAIILQQNGIKIKDIEDFQNRIPPEVLLTMEKYKLEINIIEKPL